MEKKLYLIMVSLVVVALIFSGVVASQNWTKVNYDDNMSRNSPQTQIGKDNVDQLEVKWILNTGATIEGSPLIIGDIGYAQNNNFQVIAFDLETGLNKWKYDPKVNSSWPSHGLAYDDGVIYAPTGPNNTIVALNSEDGKKIWESSAILPLKGTYMITAPPLIWEDYVIAGSATGDVPLEDVNNQPIARGTVTALDKKTGKIKWQIETAVGDWIEGKNATINGGATVWSGGAIDTEKGIVYLPCGNPAPDFNATSRPGKTPYANNVIAVNITTGKILWATPLIAADTVLNVTLPDTHDWDTNWGTNLVTVNSSNRSEKLVISHNKRGDIMAMDTVTGKPLWWTNVAYTYRTSAQASPNGSGTVWPSPDGGIQAYSAFDENNVYVAVTNQARNYFSEPEFGHADPVFSAMPNGIGNGSITAVDLKTGKVKWEHKTNLPTWVSPLVTNGIVFSGTITPIGNNETGFTYPFDDYGGPDETPLITSGIIRAFDADTGEDIWEFNVGAPVGIGGPSAGNGILLVPTGHGQTPNEGGYIVAFGFPEK